MNHKINQIIRHGAYGIVIQNSKMLLTQKKSGPYKGLWGLPGGGIEFGESPEETLKRELLEEAALHATQCKLLDVVAATGDYNNSLGERYGFHHIGIIFTVSDIVLMPDLIPEEEGRWIFPQDVKDEELTPFARFAVSTLAP